LRFLPQIQQRNLFPLFWVHVFLNAVLSCMQ
jgi:hypothetical protein